MAPAPHDHEADESDAKNSIKADTSIDDAAVMDHIEGKSGESNYAIRHHGIHNLIKAQDAATGDVDDDGDDGDGDDDDDDDERHVVGMNDGDGHEHAGDGDRNGHGHGDGKISSKADLSRAEDQDEKRRRSSNAKDQAARSVPFFKLFAFADTLDLCLMIFGAMGAATNGLTLPLMTLIFGQLIDAFGQNSASNTGHVQREVSKVCLETLETKP
jgi:hypothetical protein